MLELNDKMRFYIFNGKTNLRGGYMRLCATFREEMRQGGYFMIDETLQTVGVWTTENSGAGILTAICGSSTTGRKAWWNMSMRTEAGDRTY